MPARGEIEVAYEVGSELRDVSRCPGHSATGGEGEMRVGANDDVHAARGLRHEGVAIVRAIEWAARAEPRNGPIDGCDVIDL